MRPETCNICHMELDVPGVPESQDCGGDCAQCMADAGDPDFAHLVKPAQVTVRLSAAQSEAARRRVEECRGGWTYWTPKRIAPVYATRADAEAASIAEWRANL